MNRLIIVVALFLTGCGAKPDNTICRAIFDPPSAPGTEAAISNQSDPEWQMRRADACVHRFAYRLAKSSDPAQIVAKAAVEACREPILESASVNAQHELAEGYLTSGNVQPRINEITANYEKLALLKVVEGRAGNCKA